MCHGCGLPRRSTIYYSRKLPQRSSGYLYSMGRTVAGQYAQRSVGDMSQTDFVVTTSQGLITLAQEKNMAVVDECLREV